jgi:hypothetical protein
MASQEDKNKVVRAEIAAFDNVSLGAGSVPLSIQAAIAEIGSLDVSALSVAGTELTTLPTDFSFTYIDPLRFDGVTTSQVSTIRLARLTPQEVDEIMALASSWATRCELAGQEGKESETNRECHEAGQKLRQYLLRLR